MARKKSAVPHKPRRKGCLITLLIFLLLGIIGAVTDDGPKTPSASDAIYPLTITATVSPTETPTASPTLKPTPTASPTPSPTLKPTPTASPTPSPTLKPTPTASPTPSPTSTAPGYVSLTQGDCGDDVRKLQDRLNTLGYSVGTADGIYGAKTATAVSAFQQAASLRQTGVASAATQQALFAADAPRAPKPTATVRPAEPESDYMPSTSYIGNRNTKKFHHSWCSSVDEMKSSNRVALSSRSAAISAGYVPCKRCDP